MDSGDFKRRTRQYALQIIRLTQNLPRDYTSQVLGRQLVRCGTSVGANYRAACCGKSTADFIAKMAIVQEEADESIYWMELLIESEIVNATEISSLMTEGREILAMTVASIKTARQRIKK